MTVHGVLKSWKEGEVKFEVSLKQEVETIDRRRIGVYENRSYLLLTASWPPGMASDEGRAVAAGFAAMERVAPSVYARVLETWPGIKASDNLSGYLAARAFKDRSTLSATLRLSKKYKKPSVARGDVDAFKGAAREVAEELTAELVAAFAAGFQKRNEEAAEAKLSARTNHILGWVEDKVRVESKEATGYDLKVKALKLELVAAMNTRVVSFLDEVEAGVEEADREAFAKAKATILGNGYDLEAASPGMFTTSTLMVPDPGKSAKS